MTFEILLGIVARLGEVCSSEFEIKLFKVAFLLEFFGAFRIGELVSPSKKVQGGLGSHEVECSNGRVSLWLRKSKTDQAGRGKLVQVYPIPGSPLCPMEAVRVFLKVRPARLGAFLVHEDETPLLRFQFGANFKKCLGKLVLEFKAFSSHSFRIGATTEAARQGMDIEAVKRIGQWESNRFRSYVRPHLVVGL